MDKPNIPSLDPDMMVNGYRVQGERIGNGSYSSVYKVEKQNRLYAMKCMYAERFNEHGGVVGEMYKEEIRVLQELDSKYVIRFYENFDIEQNTKKIQCAIIEYCNCGTLDECLKKQNKSRFKQEEALQYFKQIVRGIYQFHKKNIVHRDLKLENILVQDNDQIKIADFGFCQRLKDKSQKMKLQLGTRGYQAPEVYSNQNYDIRCDMFSLGVILYKLLFGQLPFSINSNANYLNDIKHQNPPIMSSEVSEDVKNIICKMLKENPSERLTYSELFKLKLFQTESAINQLSADAKEIEESIQFYNNKELFQPGLLQQQEQVIQHNSGGQQAYLKYQAIQYLIEIIDLFLKQKLNNPTAVFFPIFMLLKELYWQIVDFNEKHENNFQDAEKVRKLSLLKTTREVLYSYLQILIGYLIYNSFNLSDSIREGKPEIQQLSQTQDFDKILIELMNSFLRDFYQQQINKDNFDEEKQKLCYKALLNLANYMEMVRQRNLQGQYDLLEKMEKKRLFLENVTNLKEQVVKLNNENKKNSNY